MRRRWRRKATTTTTPPPLPLPLPLPRPSEPLAFYTPLDLPDGLRVERYPHDDIAGLTYVELSLPVRHPVKWWQRRRVTLRITQEQALAFAQVVLREYTAGRL